MRTSVSETGVEDPVGNRVKRKGKSMKFRQVHLDFHTSERIGEIGRDFNPDDFCAALREGHINSITLFSKCHHGWSYHPTKTNRMHPNLSFDLF